VKVSKVSFSIPLDPMDPQLAVRGCYPDGECGPHGCVFAIEENKLASFCWIRTHLEPEGYFSIRGIQ